MSDIYCDRCDRSADFGSKDALKYFYDKRKYKNYRVNDPRAYNKYCRECNTNYRRSKWGLNEEDIDELQKYETGNLDFVVDDDGELSTYSSEESSTTSESYESDQESSSSKYEEEYIPAYDLAFELPEDEIYVVEKILKKRGNEYKIKWVGYSKPTWEQKDVIENDVPDMVKKFNKRNRVRRR